MSGLSAGLSNPNSYGNACYLDNIPTDCARALLMLNHGAAEPPGGLGTSLGGRFIVDHGSGEFRDSYYYFGNIGPGGQRNTTVNQQNTEPPDFVRDFYKYYQKRLARCIWKIFRKNALGEETNVPDILEHQTIRNAPDVDMSKTFSGLGGAWGSVGDSDLSRGRYGTVNIASNINERNVGDFGVVLTRHQKLITTYGHELGNLLMGRIYGSVKDASLAQGSPTGGVNPIPNLPFNDADQDPGQRLESCLFWEKGAPDITKIK